MNKVTSKASHMANEFLDDRLREHDIQISECAHKIDKLERTLRYQCNSLIVMAGAMLVMIFVNFWLGVW